MLRTESTDPGAPASLALDSETRAAVPPRAVAPRPRVDVERVARARKLLDFARRVASSPSKAGPDLVTARGLLARSLEALGDDADDPTAAPDREVPFAEAARAVEALVIRAERASHTRRRDWIRRVGFVVLLVAAVTVVAIDTLSRPWVAYTFRTSSTYEGYKRTGKLGEARERDLLFHTKEDESPYVEVDLGEVRDVHEVTVRNRTSCCAERAVPLAVELATQAGAWTKVAERVERFDTWQAKFPEQPARWVRLRVLRKSILHLREIEIR